MVSSFLVSQDFILLKNKNMKPNIKKKIFKIYNNNSSLMSRANSTRPLPNRENFMKFLMKKNGLEISRFRIFPLNIWQNEYYSYGRLQES